MKEKRKVWIAGVVLLAVAFFGVMVFLFQRIYRQNQYEKSLSLGDRYLQELNYEDAALAFLQAIRLDPKKEDGYLKLADTYLAADKEDPALEILEKGLQSAAVSDRLKAKKEEIKDQKNRQEEEEKAISRETAYWSEEAVPSYGVLNLDAVTYRLDSQSEEHVMNGLISCYDFPWEDQSYRLLVGLTDGNVPGFYLYRREKEAYQLVQKWLAEGTAFRSFWGMEHHLKVYADRKDEKLRIICGVEALMWEGLEKNYQVFTFDGSEFHPTFTLLHAAETTNIRVECNQEVVFETEQDEQSPDSIYATAAQAVDGELEQAGLTLEDFAKPEQPGADDICYLANSRQGTSWAEANYQGEALDYTNLRDRLKELGITETQASFETEALPEVQESESSARMEQKVPADQIESQILEIRAIFNEQMSHTADGSYEAVDLGNGFTAWLNNGQIQTVKTRAEEVTETQEEIYNFDDGKLVFAFKKEGGREDRFYYREDSLFRWCYPDFASIHDNEYENPEFVSQGIAYRTRGYELYHMAEETMR